MSYKNIPFVVTHSKKDAYFLFTPNAIERTQYFCAKDPENVLGLEVGGWYRMNVFVWQKNQRSDEKNVTVLKSDRLIPDVLPAKKSSSNEAMLKTHVVWIESEEIFGQKIHYAWSNVLNVRLVYTPDEYDGRKFEPGSGAEVWCSRICSKKENDDWKIVEIVEMYTKVYDPKRPIEIIHLSDSDEAEPSASTSSKNHPKFQGPQNWYQEKARLLRENGLYKLKNEQSEVEKVQDKAEIARLTAENLRLSTENDKIVDKYGSLHGEIYALKEQLKQEKVSLALEAFNASFFRPSPNESVPIPKKRNKKMEPLRKSALE